MLTRTFTEFVQQLAGDGFKVIEIGFDLVIQRRFVDACPGKSYDTVRLQREAVFVFDECLRLLLPVVFELPAQLILLLHYFLPESIEGFELLLPVDLECISY